MAGAGIDCRLDHSPSIPPPPCSPLSFLLPLSTPPPPHAVIGSVTALHGSAAHNTHCCYSSAWIIGASRALCGYSMHAIQHVTTCPRTPFCDHNGLPCPSILCSYRACGLRPRRMGNGVDSVPTARASSYPDAFPAATAPVAALPRHKGNQPAHRLEQP